MSDDDEVFCERCFAGVDSDEHHTKCVVPGFGEMGESAEPDVIDAEVFEETPVERRAVVVHVPLDFGKPPIDENGNMSVLDAELLRLAAKRMSLEEIGAELDLDPARVGERVKQILSTSDWLSLLELETILWRQMSDLADDLRRRIEAGGDSRDYATLARIVGRQMDQLNTRHQQQKASKTQIRSAHAATMAAGIEAGFEAFVYDLQEQGMLADGVSVPDLRRVMFNAISRATAKVTERVVA